MNSKFPTLLIVEDDENDFLFLENAIAQEKFESKVHHACDGDQAIKYLAGFEEGLLTDRLLTYDAKSMTFHIVDVNRDAHCVACGVKQITGSSIASNT